MNLAKRFRSAAIPAGIVGVFTAIAYYVTGRRKPSRAMPSFAIPDVSHLVRADVFESFPAWVQQFEGAVPHMYQDVKGYVTTGIGNLVDPVELALKLPWLRPDGSLASEDEIRDEWERVKAMPKALLASRYDAPDALRLSSESIAQLVRQHSANDILALVKAYPDFPTFPAPAQKAIMGMAWALGAYFPAKWPKFSAAVRAQDWKMAAENASSKDFTADRNTATRELFLQAAAVA